MSYEAQLQERYAGARGRLLGAPQRKVRRLVAPQAVLPSPEPTVGPWRYPDPAPYDHHAEPPKVWQPPGRRILAEVAEKRKVPLQDMLSNRRFLPIIEARQEAYYRLVTETSMGWAQIGRLIGKDHTTVLHGCRRYAERHGLPFTHTPHPGRRRAVTQ